MKQDFLNDELPPFLKDLKEKGDGFNVPEGYFEELEDAVFDRLNAVGDLGKPVYKPVKTRRLFPLFIRPGVSLALAAALALILTAVWFVRQPTTPVQENAFASTDLTEDDIETYVLENLHEFEPEQLASLTPDVPEEEPELPAATPDKKSKSAIDELHPDDLEKVLDEMTDEELEDIL